MSASLEPAADEFNVRIPIRPFEIRGTLTLPAQPRGLVLFAHGSGSSRFSARNRFVAEALLGERFGALILDLLTSDEQRIDDETHLVRSDDIDLMAGRLIIATDWALRQERLGDLGLGYFGTSAGIAVALVAATERASEVKAIVSAGGRPDLAGPALVSVQTPTLLIVGGRDDRVLTYNRSALAQLPVADKQLEIVPDATHMFKEAGALEKVAKLAGRWFQRFLDPQRRVRAAAREAPL